MIVVIAVVGMAGVAWFALGSLVILACVGGTRARRLQGHPDAELGLASPRNYSRDGVR